MSRLYNAGNALKNFIKSVTHEVPTGPHTDVTRRKVNPSQNPFSGQSTLKKKVRPVKIPKTLKEKIKK